MSSVVTDLRSLCDDNRLAAMDSKGFRDAQDAGRLLMAVTSDGTEVAVECGWDGEAAMFALDARARTRLAAAFNEAGDAHAGAWLEQAPEQGRGRIFAIKPDATLLVSWVGDSISIDHESPVDWEPCFFGAALKPS